MGERAPAFSFYARDFLASTVTMNLMVRGAYITLLAYQWDHGDVPDDPEALGMMLGCSGQQAHRLWLKLSPKFTRSPDGRLRNSRLERERTKQLDRRAALAENGKKGAESRWDPKARHKRSLTMA